MRKPRSNDSLDRLLSLLRIMPWWVGPSMAAMTFLSIRFVLPALFPHGSNDGSQTLRDDFYAALSWFAPGVILLVWLVAEGFKFSSRRLFDRQEDIADIRDLSWLEFERFITETYRRRGYLAQHVGAPGGDGGIDIILLGNGERILVQCKQWKAFRVGVAPVRELLGVVTSERADRGILVTTGRFTPEARRFAERNERLELVDGGQLAEMIAGIRTQAGTARETGHARK